MGFDAIGAFPHRDRTPVERMRDLIYRQRASDQPTEVRLPGVFPVYGNGSPPAGMFKIHVGEEER